MPIHLSYKWERILGSPLKLDVLYELTFTRVNFCGVELYAAATPRDIINGRTIDDT